MRACAACELRFVACVDGDAYARAATRGFADARDGGVCGLCLGALQIDAATRATTDSSDSTSRVLEVDAAWTLVRRAVLRGHAPRSFRLRVILPAATLTRERAERARRGMEASARVTAIDEALRLMVVPMLRDALGCEEDREGAAYALTVKYKYGDDARETEMLSAVKLKMSADERKGMYRGKHLKWHKSHKRKRGKSEADFLSHLSSPEDPFAEEFDAAQRAYEEAARKLEDERFAGDAFVSLYPSILTEPRFRVRCVIEPHHEPVHLGGWYIKLDRGVPQSPWVLRESGERVGRGSVVEAIESVILDRFGSRGAKFNSSGREDMDVRMLEEGRPFASQVHDPKRSAISAEEISEMESEINARSNVTGVRVRGLCLTRKENYHAVGKQSEESEKEKSYVALCRISRPITPEDHEKIAGITRLVVQQATPTRVAHRRADLIRPRTIVSMSSESVLGTPDAFTLRLRTQAGTYIKEFVHGDNGRTKPSLGDLLGCQAQILQLDVTAVDDDWNPAA